MTPEQVKIGMFKISIEPNLLLICIEKNGPIGWLDLKPSETQSSRKSSTKSEKQ